MNIQLLLLPLVPTMLLNPQCLIDRSIADLSQLSAVIAAELQGDPLLAPMDYVAQGYESVVPIHQ